VGGERYPASLIKGVKISLKSFTQQSLPKSYQAASGFYQNSKASTLVQWAKSRENIPDKRFPTANQKRDFSGHVAF